MVILWSELPLLILIVKHITPFTYLTINFNKSNNKLENLEWCTDSENKIHAYAIGLKTPGNQYTINIKKNLLRYKMKPDRNE